jgi:hypothetical protein
LLSSFRYFPLLKRDQRTAQKLFCSKPKGYPFKMKAAASVLLGTPSCPGLQFLADVPLGRMLIRKK